MATLADSAYELATLGFSVFPIKPKGKSPLTQHGYKDASQDAAVIADWWTRWPNANIGIDCGGSHILVLDIDGPEGARSMKELVGDNADPVTRTAKTGKGWHLYFRENGKSYKNAVKFRDGLDIRTAGGSVVAPPSVHESGTVYEWMDLSPMADIPDWLAFELEPYEKPTGQTTDIISRQITHGDEPDIPDGQRGDVLMSIAGTMRRRGMSRDAIEAALLITNKERCKPPCNESRIRKIAESVCNYPSVAGFNFTDFGNAERFQARYQEEARFQMDTGQWLLWTGNYWQPDERKRVMVLARGVARALHEEALKLKDPDAKKALLGYALRLEERHTVISMVEFAKSLLPINTAELDTDKLLFNAANGTVDLRTGELKEPAFTDYITKCAPVKYDRAAQCPRWEKFLLEIFDSDFDLISFLQRAIGYSLTGDTREQCLFILHGPGSNGKTTFLETMMKMLGDYGKQTTPETVMQSRKDAGQASPELAMLPGVRFLATIETEEDRKLNESLVKQLTGGDTVMARRLYQEFFQFKPEFKLWLASNHLPAITGTDWAIWRRIRKIPFNVTFPDEQQDKLLPMKLAGELSGILNWALLGALDWLDKGLDPPASVLNATKQYRDAMDALGDFLSDCIEEAPGITTTKAECYRRYEDWCRENGETSVTQRKLSLKLQERNFAETRVGENRTRCWANMAVRGLKS